MYSVEAYLEILIIWITGVKHCLPKANASERKKTKNKKEDMKTVLLGNLSHTYLFYDALIFSSRKIKRWAERFHLDKKTIVIVKLFIIAEYMLSWKRN